MEIAEVILSSFLSLAALFLLTRLIGNKQISELTMFDYVIGISIGSIAANMATEDGNPLRELAAMVIYAGTAWAIALITAKSPRLRRILSGRATVLMHGGEIYRKNLKKAHLDLNDFLMQCRISGYFDLSAIDTAVLEPNGKISFFPCDATRPATPQDLNIVPQSGEVFYSVIMDGAVMEHNLRRSGHDMNWLKNELSVQGIDRVEEVFYAALDRNGTLRVFRNTPKKECGDMFG